MSINTYVFTKPKRMKVGNLEYQGDTKVSLAIDDSMPHVNIWATAGDHAKNQSILGRSGEAMIVEGVNENDGKEYLFTAERIGWSATRPQTNVNGSSYIFSLQLKK